MNAGELNEKNVVVVGVGALGSHFILFSRNFSARYTLVDYDRVEQKNVQSQFHSKMVVGRNKAQALQQSLKGLFGVSVKAIPHKLTSDNVEQLLSSADLVVDCLDNGAGRRLIQDYVRNHNIPCLHGALSANGDFGSAIWDEYFTIDNESSLGQATCEDGEHLPFIAFVASTLAYKAQLFIKEGKKSSSHIHTGGLIAI